MNPQLQEILRLHQRGELQAAEAGYRAYLELYPDDPHATHFLGVLALQTDQPEEAATLLEQAVSKLPEEPVFLCNLGIAKKRIGQHDEAVAVLQKSVRLAPKLPQGWHNLGLAYEAKGDQTQAVAAFLKAQELYGNDYAGKTHLVSLLNGIGSRLNLEGHPAEASDIFRHITRMEPDDPHGWSGLASTLTLQGRPLQAQAAFDAALKLRPNDANIYNNRANAWRDAGLLENAMADYEKSMSLDPLNREARSNALFTALSMPQGNAASHGEMSRRLAGAYAHTPSQHLARHENDAQERPWRIGIVSPDLRAHPVSWFMLAWFEHRDRRMFNLSVYSTSPQIDHVTDHIRSLCNEWVDAAHDDDKTLAQRIGHDRIDLLLDLSGHTADNRLGVFALRPAPVQATYLGYAGTTGLGCFDARIADWVTEPAEEEGISSEPLIRMDGSYLCYHPPRDTPEVVPPPCVKNRHITFGCSTQLGKVTDDTLLLWKEVLAAVPRSRFLLRSKALNDPLVCKRMQGRMARAGINPKRVKMEGALSLIAHLSSWGKIDITLDTTPFNLATQACESLWMGAPVVTLIGDRHAGRLGASLLKAAGLHDLVSHDRAEYVANCVKLANDHERLSQLRTNLRSLLLADHGLMDQAYFARRFEHVLSSLLKRSVSDQAS